MFLVVWARPTVSADYAVKFSMGSRLNLGVSFSAAASFSSPVVVVVVTGAAVVSEDSGAVF